MAGSGIDPRYPAEFQRGGETSSKAVEEPQVPPEYSEKLDPDSAVPKSDVSKEAATAEAPATDKLVDTDKQQAQALGGRRAWWLFPFVTSFVLMVAGIIVLFIGNLVPSSLEQNPTQLSGMASLPWGSVIPYQAGYIFTAGLLALLVTMLALVYTAASNQVALLWRSIVITLSIAAIAAGYWCGTHWQFNMDLSVYASEKGHLELPFDRLVSQAAFPLLFVGLLLFSLALCLPRVSRTNRFRAASISWFALGLVGASITVMGFLLLFAPQLLPLEAPRTLSLDDGASTAFAPAWTDVISTISQAPIWAGLFLFVGAAVGFGIQLRARPLGATDAVSQPEH